MVIRRCWFRPSSALPCALDRGTQTPRPEKGRILEAESGGRGSLSAKSSDPHPTPTSGQIWGTRLETPKVLPGSPPRRVLRRDFPNATKEPRGGPGAGRRAAGGTGVPGPGPGTAARGVGPCRVCPHAGQPGTHHAGSGSPGPSPCPTGGAAGGGAADTRARRLRRRPRVRAECGGGTRKDSGGRRPEVGPGHRSAPRARQPAPLPAPSWGSGRAEGGPVARPTLAGASGRAPARNSRIPPASSAAATHRP